MWRRERTATTLDVQSTAPRSKEELYIVTPPYASPRAYTRASAAALAVLAAMTVAVAPAAADDPVTSNFDARPEVVSAAPAPGAKAREDLRDRLGRFGTLSLDPRAGTVRAVGRLDGFLTGPSGRDGADVALGYVRENAAALGVDATDVDDLELVSRSFAGGVEHLKWEQRHAGIPVADAGLDAAVTGAGRLMSITGPPAHDVAVRSTDPAIGAREAYAAASESGGAGGAAPAVESTAGGPEQKTTFRGGGEASLALYSDAGGYRLGWRVLAPVSSTGVYDVMVDARTGAVVQRANLVKFATNAKVFRNNPATAAAVDQDLAPWLSSGTALQGPNAHAFLDLHDTVGPTNLTPEAGSEVVPGEYPLNVRPTTGGGDEADGCLDLGVAPPPTRACTWDASLQSTAAWSANRNQSATQLFYFVNAFHDYLQNDPAILFGNGEGAFSGNDPVLAQAMDGADGPNHQPDAAHANNASFLTLPDGNPGLMQSHLWRLPFGAYDGANDAAMVWHEYTHGMTDRLVTDANGFGALTSVQAGAIGEGLSDWYALDAVIGGGLQPDDPGVADVRFGKYFDNATGNTVRYQSIDCAPNVSLVTGSCLATPGPSSGTYFTYADFGRIAGSSSAGVPEVHADGEIVAQTLWQLRARLGAAPARRLITNALRMVPPQPSFLDLRNAILQASTTQADDDVIWDVFAERGMGYFAASSGSTDTTPVADTTRPSTLGGTGSVTGLVFDEDDRAVPGARVAISGHDTGLGPDHTALTGSDGRYTIPGVLVSTNPAGSVYPEIRATKPGYRDDVLVQATIRANQSLAANFGVERDYASSTAGARVSSFTGPDNTNVGCGPGGLLDDSSSSVWGTDNDAGGHAVVVDLGAPIDIGRIAIDPSTGCGDDVSAALKQYAVLGAPGPDGPFTTIASGALSASSSGQLTDVFTGVQQGVRYVKLKAIAPQDAAVGRSGHDYIDVAELHVGRSPGSEVGPVVTTGAATGIDTDSADVRGTVVANTRTTQVVVEYGTTTGYGATAAAGAFAPGTAATPFAASLTGLAPATTYHYRAVAIVGSERYPGADRTFTTAAIPAPPPPAPTPTPTPTPVPTPTPTPTPAPTTLVDAKLKADRKGIVKIRVRFGDKAPTTGPARLRVIGPRRRAIAEAFVTVRPSRNVTKTLRLSTRGRRQVRPGKARRVVLELRLPGGQKVKRTLTLARAKR